MPGSRVIKYNLVDIYEYRDYYILVHLVIGKVSGETI